MLEWVVWDDTGASGPVEQPLEQGEDEVIGGWLVGAE